MAWDQVELAEAAPVGAPLVQFGAAASSESDGNGDQNQEDAGVTATSMIAALQPRLTIFRAPTDNDGFKLMPELAERLSIGGRALPLWQRHGVDTTPADELVEHQHVVEPLHDDAVIHHHRIVVPAHLDDLARVGVEFEIPAASTVGDVDQIAWYGRGPLENYPDRNGGAVLGEWTAPIDDPPYLVPQEYGLRTDCRWMELRRGRRRALRIDVIDPVALHMSAIRFTDQELYAASHETNLDALPVATPGGRPALVLHLDVAHRGIGTGACGPDVLPEYRIAPGEYRFSYRLNLG